jgi:hypothetical protein
MESGLDPRAISNTSKNIRGVQGENTDFDEIVKITRITPKSQFKSRWLQDACHRDRVVCRGSLEVV